MTTKPPFTLDGTNAKIKELYALRDIDLQTQTKLIVTDLKSWVGNNFALDERQLSYLNEIDTRFFITAGPLVEVCLNNRLKVKFIFPKDPIPTDSSKLIIINPNPIPSYDQKNKFKIAGDLTIEITSN